MLRENPAAAQQQYQDVMASETFSLAQAIQQSWLMKISRLLRKRQ
ncbi:MAG: hypothetical protein NTZ51_10835 [Proteobacteria bacterium]|jgi:hypothetical protein|nr:hypothetical protein [Pseudomonadota bacterium]